jgi:quercetin dioxygenase-like cupin family protein
LESGRKIWFLGGLATIHIGPDDTGGGFALLERRAPAGEQAPLHVHRADDEGFYLLEGRVTLWVGPDRTDLEPGDFALAPHGIPHTYRVESGEGARWLITSSDGSFARFVEAYGEPAEDETPPEPGEPDLERLTALGEEHGIEILGPPGTLPG